MSTPVTVSSGVPQAEALYQEALAVMRHLYDDVQAGRPLPGTAVLALVDRLVEGLQNSQRALLALTAGIPTDHPMATHAVNACLLAAATARGINAEPAQIRDVAAAALLHDVGLAHQLQQSTGREIHYGDIKQHFAQTVTLLDQLPELAHLTVYLMASVGQAASTLQRGRAPTVHEEELAKVIRLVDLYEALTHPRADGSPVAFAAVRTILTAQKLFDARLMKALFDQVGMYPVGTWVQLSTGEAGLVTGVQQGLPLRPFVTLCYDRDGRRMRDTRELNLAEHSTIFIKHSLDAEPIPRT